MKGAPPEPGRKPSSSHTALTDSLAVSALLKDRELGDFLSKLETSALDSIAEENYIDALSLLKKSEEMLESISTQGKSPDKDAVLSVLNNTACCYQRCETHSLGSLDKCAAYLEACSLYSINTKTISGKLPEVAETLKRAKHQCLVNVQLCAILSQLGKHEEALEKAKHSVRLAHFCIECTGHAYKLHQLRYQLSKDRSEGMSEAMEQTHLLAKRALVMLKSIQDLVKNGDFGDGSEHHMRSALGVRAFADWVYELSISDIMFIEPISMAELKAKGGIRVEFTKDYMLDKVANIAVGYFCVSTELQFLRGKQAFNPERDQEAYCLYREMYHMKSLKLLEAFFPQECPLVQHVSQTYEKRYVNELQEIPEENDSVHARTRAKSARSRPKPHSTDATMNPKLPVLRERAKPRHPIAPPKKGSVSGRPRVGRKSSMELKGHEQDRLRSASSFGMYQSRRKDARSRPIRGHSAHNRSFDRERRNKSAELMRGVSDDSQLEEYVAGVMEAKNQSPRPGSSSQFIVS